MDFNKLIENNKHNIKNIIRLITREENEDIEQEVYIKAWQNRDKYEECGNFKGWINTIAKNLSKDYLKKSQNKYETKPQDENTLELIRDKKNSPEQNLVIKLRQIQTTKAINELRGKLKEVIILYEIEGYSYEQIAKKLKCPVGTVKSRLYSAKKEMYEKLKDVI